MPNTLAHIACNGFISKPIFKDSGLIWIYTGCIIPDLPWINQRIVEFLFSGINGYDLKAYAIAQATLLLSLILSAALAMLSDDVKRVFKILSLGVILHLALDSLQIKWANGVHIFAPFDWQLINFGLFWPESFITYLLSLLGLIFFFLNFNKFLKSSVLLSINFRKLRYFIPLLLYFLLPFAFMGQIEKADVHYISTLRNIEERTGKYVELDRKRIQFNEQTKSTWIEAYNGQLIELKDMDKINSTKLSVKGVFITDKKIEVVEYKENWALFRDGASYIGVFLIFISWVMVIIKQVRRSSRNKDQFIHSSS